MILVEHSHMFTPSKIIKRWVSLQCVIEKLIPMLHGHRCIFCPNPMDWLVLEVNEYLIANFFCSLCFTVDCGGNFTCSSADECVPLSDVCDFVPDCSDQSDENDCDYPSKHLPASSVPKGGRGRGSWGRAPTPSKKGGGSHQRLFGAKFSIMYCIHSLAVPGSPAVRTLFSLFFWWLVTNLSPLSPPPPPPPHPRGFLGIQLLSF